MKKLLFLVASLAMTTMVSAQEVTETKEFTDDLYVTVNGETTGPQETTVVVEYLSDGNITLVLKNFVLDSGEGDYIPVGNIEVDNMTLSQEAGVSYGTFHYDGDVTIKDGDDGIDWVGPWLLGTIPIDMSGELNDAQLYLTIDIDLSSSLGQVIYVKFGEEIVNTEGAGAQYQFPNSDFESEFVTAYVSSSIFSGTTTYTEPLGWHGYATIAGTIGSLGRSNSKLVASDDVREGATGKQSACVVATSVMGIIANGIMTNGQVYSNSMTATDGANNYNFSDQANGGDTDTYYDNSQFYTPFTGRPDYMNVWLKFVPAAEDNGNARVSVYLHKDGAVMYDPTDNVEDMSIVVAHAEESIPTNDGAWTLYSIPFDYDGEGEYDGAAVPSFILATFSTNETPGKGAANDCLYVDDIEMVYLSELHSATYNGNEIVFTDGAATVEIEGEYDADLLECVASGAGATVELDQPTEENGNVLTITVKGDNISEDETNYHTYTVTFTAAEEEEVETIVYTDELVVTVNGETLDPIETSVTVEYLGDGSINFVLDMDGTSLAVGNIEIDGLALNAAEDVEYQTFSFDGTIRITSGSLEGVTMWWGPLLGSVPVVMEGKITDEKLYVTISITLSTLGMDIEVVFGSDFDSEEEPGVEPDLTLYATYGGVELTDGAVIEGAYDASKLEVTAGEGATVATEYDDATQTLTITVTAEDESESKTYTVTFTVATGIKAVTETSTDESVYDLMGRPVSGTQQKGIYVKKGKKVLIK